VKCRRSVGYIKVSKGAADAILKSAGIYSIYGPKYEKKGMEKSDESRTRRDEQGRKYSKIDKRANDKMFRSPRDNGGG